MKVSVIIPLFNGEAFIARAINSVLRQTVECIELIVVDDGSTDGGPEIVAGIDDARLRMIRQENAGPGAARNAGLAAASGEYVAFLDADDEWFPTFLERGIQLLDMEPEASFVHFGVLKITETRYGPVVPPDVLYQGLNGLPDDFPPEELQSILNYISFCSTLLRRDTVVNLGGFYAKPGVTYAEDTVLLIKLLITAPFYISYEGQAVIHCEASSLSNLLIGVIPAIPCLLDPDAVLAVCPPENHRVTTVLAST